MASKKYLELQDFTSEELTNELTETLAQFKKMKFEHALKGLENPMTLREVRRDVARLRTEVRRRELAEMPAEALSERSRIRKRRRNK